MTNYTSVRGCRPALLSAACPVLLFGPYGAQGDTVATPTTGFVVLMLLVLAGLLGAPGAIVLLRVLRRVRHRIRQDRTATATSCWDGPTGEPPTVSLAGGVLAPSGPPAAVWPPPNGPRRG